MINILSFLYFKKYNIKLLLNKLYTYNYIYFTPYTIILSKIKKLKIKNLFNNKLF